MHAYFSYLSQKKKKNLKRGEEVGLLACTVLCCMLHLKKHELIRHYAICSKSSTINYRLDRL